MNPDLVISRPLSPAALSRAGLFLLGSGDLMISERDLWLAARSMVQRYGKLAGIEAADRANELLETGDSEGSAVWQRILAAIDKMQATEPKPGEGVRQHPIPT